MPSQDLKLCFVTVGSTQFDDLVLAITSDAAFDVLHSLGFSHLLIQSGSGIVPKRFTRGDKEDGSESWFGDFGGVKTRIFRYKKEVVSDMIQADIIIGHAGAGTCIEALEIGKPFIAVVNDTLMDNHQSELAERLAEDGHLLCTVPRKLIDTLQDPHLFQLLSFPKLDTNLFPAYIKSILDT